MRIQDPLRPMPTLRAVTFDFWSTLYEPREPRQLEAVLEARADVLQQALSEAGLPFPLDQVRAAYRPPTGCAGASVTLEQTVDALCGQLSLEPQPALRRHLVRALDELAGQLRWARAPGAPAVLRHLRQLDYRLALVADAHFPSGRVIRQVLGADGTLMYFQAFAFSDEVGVCKPDVAVFRHALHHLDMEAEPGDVVHVGDEPGADVAGARAAGLRSVRYAGWHDEAGSPDADAVILDFRDLPDLIRDWQ